MSGQQNARAIRRTAALSALFAAAMVALAFASVPLYRLFCATTGFGGTTQRAAETAVPGRDQVAALGGRTVSVRFDSNVAPDLPWTFVPARTHETVLIGERRLAFYRATNLSDRPVTGTATFNVSPDTAGVHFIKIACFCFTEQTLGPGQTVDMPVTYYIDPGFVTDPDADKIDEITLSYTFFPSTAAGTGQPGVTPTAAKLDESAPSRAPQVQG